MGSIIIGDSFFIKDFEVIITPSHDIARSLIERDGERVPSIHLQSMSLLTQIVPYELSQDDETAQECFERDYSELITLLQQSYNGLLLQIFTPEKHSPYPVRDIFPQVK
jgi:hypothetical protein